MTRPGEPLHVRGVVLPEAEHRDIWIRDGQLTFEPIPGAHTVGTGWILPGLVDLHCHVGLSSQGAVPDDVAEEQALADRDAGTLLLRDAGSPADTRWMDEREELPRIIRAGRHIARTKRYLRNYGWEIEPEELVPYVEQEARRGDGWVKLVGDWIDRERGDLGPCWPREALDAAIARAHEMGARVTAHVFGGEALPDLLGAGIDGIEHGTGLSDDLIAVMAERGVSMVPTLVNIANFPSFAEQGSSKFPAYAAHMRALYERRYETVRTAFEAGVPVFAGTDAGGYMPHGLIAREVLEFVEAGIPTADAVAAASWGARAYLLGGQGKLEEGSAADLCVYAADPRTDPGTLLDPVRVLLGGRVIR
ncbi:amidohydrolase [Actinobacteria bacterium YIM 96077]|uniref:Amidohydrolase n=1 Tax=Phytoactinopolyspora halophila TaxID=1981511 RepID=A0A329QYT6_9ACTN|nr:amidohydrolase family protein [Phytoactinopolyspora halophila]AYY12724.1 amidohydrolase [Actinobacteria bacterium YIM 96077]RAW16482.1 amidohydrolase [Phytoactinopolyspora halophila]